MSAPKDRAAPRARGDEPNPQEGDGIAPKTNKDEKMKPTLRKAIAALMIASALFGYAVIGPKIFKQWQQDVIECRARSAR